MENHSIEAMLEAWKRLFPEKNTEALGIVGRVIVLGQRLQRSVEVALQHHQMSLGQYDILATLRRHSPDCELTPKELLQSVMLSSGGMTSRLDKLEEAGWIVRRQDPKDRRGVVVKLTPAGKVIIEEAIQTRLAEAQTALPNYSVEEGKVLVKLLQKWLANDRHKAE